MTKDVGLRIRVEPMQFPAIDPDAPEDAADEFPADGRTTICPMKDAVEEAA